MARAIKRLTAVTVTRLSAPGLYNDGGGLYLQISKWATKSWLYRFTSPVRCKERWMGLGATPPVTLLEARAAAEVARKVVSAGRDPIDERDAEVQARRLAAAKAMTFRECAAAYIAAHKPGWKNAKHAQQWENTLRDYVHPTLGDLPVTAIDTDLVIKCLSRIWTTKTETATRVRQRIEVILDWATARKFRSGENPARWRGHLDKLLAKPRKVARVEHHAALPYAETGAFMMELAKQEGIAARALEFTILTAARTGEALGATWGEIDLDAATWTVPASRMKSQREHAVPLSPAAVGIVEAMRAHQQSDYVFPGAKPKRPLSNMALLMTLRRMGRGDLTAHGFRSTFRDWCAEMTNFPREVAEMALAHAIPSAVEAAYRRGDLFERRRKLMQAWAAYCAKPAVAATVTPIRGAA